MNSNNADQGCKKLNYAVNHRMQTQSQPHRMVIYFREPGSRESWWSYAVNRESGISVRRDICPPPVPPCHWQYALFVIWSVNTKFKFFPDFFPMLNSTWWYIMEGSRRHNMSLCIHTYYVLLNLSINRSCKYARRDGKPQKGSCAQWFLLATVLQAGLWTLFVELSIKLTWWAEEMHECCWPAGQMQHK